MPHARSDPQTEHPSPLSWLLVAVAWTLVGVPLLWGVYMTLKKALPLFE
jgi:hypothetical protein